MKRTLTIIGTILLVAAVATPLFARARDWGKGTPPRGMGVPEQGMLSRGQTHPMKGTFANLTEEQRSQLDKLHQKFLDETAQLRTQIVSKRAELNILLNTSSPDLEKAKALQKDISDLEAKIAQARIDSAFEARKINPDIPFGTGFSRGHSPHMKDFGPLGSGPDKSHRR